MITADRQRPTAVILPQTAAVTVGLDVGGTKTEALLADEDRQMLARAQCATDTTSPEGVMSSIVTAVNTALEQAGIAPSQIEAVGIGVPGLVRPQDGVVQLAANLNLREYALAEAVTAVFQAPVILENDVRLAAIGAYQYLQAQQPVQHMAYLSIGTGIAAGVVLDGRLWRGAYGMAGEIGHIVVEPDGAVCACGQLTVFGKWTEAEGDNFVAALEPFEEATGIDVIYEGSSEFETLITVRVEGGDAPGVAGFPQPALMAQFAKDGELVNLGEQLDTDKIQENYSDAWIDLGTVDGNLVGLFYRASTKSIVWYPVKAFEEAGYEIPETWDEMIALSDTIVEEQGVTPWCISIEHGGVTGWVATDWIEDVLLRTAPPETYDAWVAHEIPFNDPAVLNAANIVADVWFNPDYVYGGSTGILSIFVGDTQTPMFEDPPQCWFHKQAAWIPDFWPEGMEPGVDSSFFYLPPIDEQYGKPVLGAGDFFAAFDDRSEVLAVMEYLASPEGVETWVKNGGFISPNSAVPADWYTDYAGQEQAKILAEATTLRFDASDLMPAEVGAGTFWSGMVDWVSADGANTEEVFQAIEDSWPSE